MTAPKIDLATELGESFFFPPGGLGLDELQKITTADGSTLHPRHLIARNDKALLDIVSTGYVACGGHSGDAVVMAETIHALAASGKVVGAHPSYPDIFRFGQVAPEGLSGDQLFAVLVSQLGSLCALAKAAGTRVTVVKCHGALSFDLADEESVANVMCLALKQVDSSISLVTFSGSSTLKTIQSHGINVLQEAYIDRRYNSSGRILSRKLPNALIVDADEAVGQALSIILKSRVVADDGQSIEMGADTLCLHGDTPNAAMIIDKLCIALKENSIMVGAPKINS